MCPYAANASDYDALLARCQSLEAELARAREGSAELRSRLEGLTGPSGPQARMRHMEAQLQQVRWGCQLDSACTVLLEDTAGCTGSSCNVFQQML